MNLKDISRSKPLRDGTVSLVAILFGVWLALIISYGVIPPVEIPVTCSTPPSALSRNLNSPREAISILYYVVLTLISLSISVGLVYYGLSLAKFVGEAKTTGKRNERAKKSIMTNILLMAVCVAVLLMHVFYLLARLSRWNWEPMAFFVYTIIVDSVAVFLFCFTFFTDGKVSRAASTTPSGKTTGRTKQSTASKTTTMSKDENTTGLDVGTIFAKAKQAAAANPPRERITARTARETDEESEKKDVQSSEKASEKNTEKDSEKNSEKDSEKNSEKDGDSEDSSVNNESEQDSESSNESSNTEKKKSSEESSEEPEEQDTESGDKGAAEIQKQKKKHSTSSSNPSDS